MLENSDYDNLPKYKIVRKSVQECKEVLYEQHRENYHIVSQKTILQGGFLGIGQKEFVELEYIIRKPDKKNIKDSTDSFEKNREALLRTLTPNVESTKQLASFDKSLQEIKDLVKQQIAMQNNASENTHENIIRIKELLEENEFTKEYIAEIETKIRAKFPLEDLNDFDKIEKQVVDWIGETISISKKKAFRPPHVIVIVGPTGVGKTTTIAKIAAQQIIRAKNENLPKPSIRLITADITRVGAEAQLQKYGEAINVQVDKAENADDIKVLYKECKDSTDVILIDTSGYSPNDSESIGRLKRNLSVDGLKPDVYLAVAASTKARDLCNIIQNYEPFAFNSMIITKCDETMQYGNIISVLSEKHKSISFVTYGQSAAKYISRPDVVNFLIRLNGFKIDRAHIEDKFGE